MGSGPSMGVRGKLLYAELAEDMLPAEDCSFLRDGGRDSLPLRLGVFAGLAVWRPLGSSPMLCTGASPGWAAPFSIGRPSNTSDNGGRLRDTAGPSARGPSRYTGSRRGGAGGWAELSLGLPERPGDCSSRRSKRRSK